MKNILDVIRFFLTEIPLYLRRRRVVLKAWKARPHSKFNKYKKAKPEKVVSDVTAYEKELKKFKELKEKNARELAEAKEAIRRKAHEDAQRAIQEQKDKRVKEEQYYGALRNYVEKKTFREWLHIEPLHTVKVEGALDCTIRLMIAARGIRDVTEYKVDIIKHNHTIVYYNRREITNEALDDSPISKQEFQTRYVRLVSSMLNELHITYKGNNTWISHNSQLKALLMEPVSPYQQRAEIGVQINHPLANANLRPSF